MLRPTRVHQPGLKNNLKQPLFHFFKDKHEVNVISPNEFTQILNFLPSSDKVLVYESNREESDVLFQEAEIIFTLDFNSLGRAKNVSYKISKSIF